MKTDFSATELSIMWHGVIKLIEEQKEIINVSKEPYTQTYKDHLKALETLEEKLAGINKDIENKVVAKIKES